MRAPAVAAALVVTHATACGVQPQDDVEPVPAHLLPTEVRPRTPAPPAAATVDVYLVESGRLVRHTQPGSGEGPVPALRSLLSAPAPQGTRRTAVPAGTSLRSASQEGDLVSLDLSGAFGDVRGRDQLLAVAQVVWTVTGQPPVRRVRLTVDGRELPLPVDTGAASSGPVTREDYASVAPRG